MKIYYTDGCGRRRLQECNLSESEVPGLKATDGIDTYKMYMIFNTIDGEDTVITFGATKQIAGNLRDAFWRSIAKHSLPTFDVDEWHANVKFVSAEDAALLKKKKKKNKSRN